MIYFHTSIAVYEDQRSRGQLEKATRNPDAIGTEYLLGENAPITLLMAEYFENGSC